MLISALKLLARLSLFRRCFLSGGFNEVWYLAQNPDVKNSGIDPLLHYALSGCREGRDPHPQYSTSGRDANFAAGKCRWLIWSFLRRYSRAELTWLPGEREYNPVLPSLVVFAHQCEAQLYGAERSLLDHLSILATLNINICVVLPSAKNQEYVTQVQRLSCRFVVMPMPWWQFARCTEKEIMANVKELLGQVNRPAVYCNTSVLWEPLVAAKELGIPAYVHVREVFEHDKALCNAIGVNAKQAIENIEQSGANILVNSHYTGQQFSHSHVVPNVVWPVRQEAIIPSAPFTVAMLSSNIAKKGVEDFFKVAVLLKSHTDIQFKLVGPVTEEVERCQAVYGNVVDAIGYINATDILPSVDAVVSLSHFAESFGRTIAEAMACGKVVVAYDFGAVNELIANHETGFLVEYKSPEAVVQALLDVFNNLQLYQAIAVNARQSASQQLGPEPVVKKFAQGFRQWLG